MRLSRSVAFQFSVISISPGREGARGESKESVGEEEGGRLIPSRKLPYCQVKFADTRNCF